MSKEELIIAIICLILLIPYAIFEIAIWIKIWFGKDSD